MIYIALGSNQGNRLGALKKAIQLLQSKCIPDLKYSIILETTALVPKHAPVSWNKPFLNMIAYGNSTLVPEDLLHTLKEIERIVGRPTIYQKWEPRIIDLDILLWDDKVIDTSFLKIPHPELGNRPFLLHLLALLNPLLKYPSSATTDPILSERHFGNIARSIPHIQTCFIRSFALFPALVGIVNITPDSFSDGGLYYEKEAAIQQVLNLAQEGASIIDLGAQSTRPGGAALIGMEEEAKRLEPVLQGLEVAMQENALSLSIDTFWPQLIIKLLDRYPITWVNDVKGNLSKEVLKVIADYKCKIVAMHSLSVPSDKNHCIPAEIDPIVYIKEWAQKKVDFLLDCGFGQESIIIDPGIGFGKSLYQSIQVLGCVKELKKLGISILMGHSRKSFMRGFSPYEAKERDLETIGISEYLQEAGIDFLRVHNVKDHQRFFVSKQVVSQQIPIFD